jgi:hypothetical protein
MIYETLQILKEQLEGYFSEVGLGKILTLENIALWDSGGDNATKVENKVVLSLINIQEETTLKNAPHFKIRNDIAEYENPPVSLNLFILISGNCETYDKSLRSISKTIEFFQGKPVFSSANTVYNRTNVAFDVFDYFKFHLKLFTPTFEQLNNIWGTLGGRQLPSVIYKIQLIQIEHHKKLSATGVITHVGGDLKGIL